MAEAEGRGAESQESCHSVEVNTIPFMPVFFSVKALFSFLLCLKGNISWSGPTVNQLDMAHKLLFRGHSLAETTRPR